jgi:D-alanyl-D-alanine dipeptidase
MKKFTPFLPADILIFLLLTPLFAHHSGDSVPPGFVDLKKAIPSIILDVRYYSTHNFIGNQIEGYHAPKCYLTEQAAVALKNVQDELLQKSLSLKVYDAYRPQRAVDHFVEWAKDLNDTTMKREFYPNVQKKDLFKDGYIADKSSHTRGSTLDLTIVPLPMEEQEEFKPGQKLCDCTLPASERFKDNSLDMGTGYDCFDTLSWTESKGIRKKQMENRMLLRSVMEKHGFKNYKKEWWHFTLRDEPYPDTYFDFVIE